MSDPTPETLSPSPSLDLRIAAVLSETPALTFGDVTSDTVAALITDVEVATVDAEEAATAARQRALDPVTIDPAARTTLADAEFARDRLAVALPRLRERLRQLQSDEEYQSWLADYERVRILRDGAAEELRAFYTETERRLVDLFARIADIDAQVQRLNTGKPDDRQGDGRYLRSVELEARNTNGFGLYRLSVLRDLKWPAWAHGQTMAWPRPTIPIWMQMMMQEVCFAPADGAPPKPMEWWEQIEERNRLQRVESERVAAFYASQQREREQREAQEAREMAERHSAERNRRAGWG